MKEEILKLLENLNLDYDKNDEYANNYEQIKKNFLLRVEAIKNAKIIDDTVISKIQKCIDEIVELDDFDKYDKINRLQRELTVLVF